MTAKSLTTVGITLPAKETPPKEPPPKPPDEQIEYFADFNKLPDASPGEQRDTLRSDIAVSPRRWPNKSPGEQSDTLPCQTVPMFFDTLSSLSRSSPSEESETLPYETETLFGTPLVSVGETPKRKRKPYKNIPGKKQKQKNTETGSFQAWTSSEGSTTASDMNIANPFIWAKGLEDQPEPGEVIYQTNHEAFMDPNSPHYQSPYYQPPPATAGDASDCSYSYLTPPPGENSHNEKLDVTPNDFPDPSDPGEFRVISEYMTQALEHHTHPASVARMPDFADSEDAALEHHTHPASVARMPDVADSEDAALEYHTQPRTPDGASLTEDSKPRAKNIFREDSKPHARATTIDSTNTTSDGFIRMERKIYRPPLASRYVDPDLGPDLLDGYEVIHGNHGRSIRQAVEPLPPRTDVIVFDKNVHQAELDKNITWGNCPTAYKEQILTIIKEHWDCFAQEGLKKHIRGFTCRIDTGAIEPVCCRAPRYGPHEAKVMTQLCQQLQDNNLIEDDDGPWGALIVLAAKPNQEQVQWEDYIWRLCVSYRKLNQVTRTFQFPIRRCDDAVADIPPWAKVFLSFDLDSGYWQVALDSESKSRTAFFTPAGKKRWCVMPMGFLNSHAIFVSMMTVLQTLWSDAWSKDCPDQKAGSQVIVDDVLLYAPDPPTLFRFLAKVLRVLQHHCVTIKLKKTKWLEPQLQFVGRDISADGNSPALSKFAAFRDLPPPTSWTELRMIIGMFGFYQAWLERYEFRIRIYRRLQSQQPPPGTVSRQQEATLMESLWLPQHQELFEQLKKEILAKPVLARPDPDSPFIVKTDWSSAGMAAVLLQIDLDDKEHVDAAIIASLGGSCFFDLQKKGLRLRPIEFLSRATSESEKSFHSYVGEASVARWSFPKWKRYLLGRVFTWLSDCNGLKRFFEGEDHPTHTIQRWRAELLQYNFTLEHRPCEMLTDCDVLSRYNMATADWPTPPTASLATPITTSLFNATILENNRSLFNATMLDDNRRPSTWYSLPPIERIGKPSAWRISKIAKCAAAKERVVLVTGASTVPIDHALELLGIQPTVLRFDDQMPTQYARRLSLSNQDEFFHGLHLDQESRVDWFVAVYGHAPTDNGKPDPKLTDWVQESFNKAVALIHAVDLKAAIIMCPEVYPSAVNAAKAKFTAPHNWHFRTATVRNSYHGGYIETDHEVLLLLRVGDANKFNLPLITSTPGAMSDVIDQDPNPNSFLWMNDLAVKPAPAVFKLRDEHEQSAHTAKLVKLLSDAKPSDGWRTFCPSRPGPNISRPRPEEDFFAAPFALWLEPDETKILRMPNQRDGSEPTRIRLAPACRPISTHEILKLLGVDEGVIQACRFIPEDIVISHARRTPGSHGLAALFYQLTMAEQINEEESDIPGIFATTPEDTLSLIPLPTDDQWRRATLEDHDLSLILAATNNNLQQLTPAPSNLEYSAAFKSGRIEVSNGIVYYYEKSKVSLLRQLRTKVVPCSLRAVVIIACHSSPFAGHSGITRTLFRVQTRYWWPGLVHDVTDGVRSCMHCNLANATSHEAQSILHTLECDVPFDVVFLDIWSPGNMPDKNGTLKVLTFIDCMTGFAMATFISQGTINARTLSDSSLTAFFGVIGLPRLIIVDADSLFAGDFRTMFQIMRIPTHAVGKGNHKAVRNERFHRYLNKVESINSADVGSLFRWKQGVLFAIYAWNAGPIDGTDIPRSLAAVGRQFPFPIDITNASPRDSATEGQAALDHFDAASPLLYKQKDLLITLNAERRRRHIELKNEGRTQRLFDIGDLVIVRKQVKSDTAKGISAKLVFKTRGPYRVIDRISPSSYKLQKLPFTKGGGKPGSFSYETSARMEKIPSTLVLHPKADGADTQFSLLHGDLHRTPLEKYLGVLDAGAYKQAPSDQQWAFVKLSSMWSEVISDNDDTDDEEDDEYHVDALDSEDEDDDVPRLPNRYSMAPTSEAASLPTNPPATSPVAAPRTIARPTATARAMNTLYQQIKIGGEMFFASYQQNVNANPTWRLGEILLKDTNINLAKRAGIYKVRWWKQHLDDRHNRTMVESRFWPEVYVLKPDGTPGKRFTVSPEKAEQEAQANTNGLSLEWQAEEFSIATRKIVGPFFLSRMPIPAAEAHKQRQRRKPSRQLTEDHRIIAKLWKLLELNAPRFGVSTSNIHDDPTTGPRANTRR
jgi:hypothetical protein